MPRRKKSETTNEGTTVVVDEKLEVDNSIGPTLYQRDENGLLKNVQYIFNDDGSVNWRAMIKEEHLFPNKGWFESRGKDCPKSTEGLEDHQLLIKLGGIKELAKLRGFSSVCYETVKCEKDHVAVSCAINFSPNYETNAEPILFEDMANATFNNTSSFATKFLETIACNRAFVRAVRNFLNVHIVGDDEIDKSNASNMTTEQSISVGPTSILKKSIASKLGIEDFASFKEKLREYWADGSYQNESVKEWQDFEDIPAKEARILLKLVSQS
tara:strand:- start:3728 stop:4537 length:810 start_codon:yes stop_codon:yes gene_type:complete